MSNIDPSADPGSQSSIEWLMERVGHCTASRFKDVLDRQKTGKPGAKRTAYLWELVIETLTGNPSEHYASVAMQYGTDTEPIARMRYESTTGRLVTETGFHHHPTIVRCGASPDGFIDDDGGIEIKAPFNSANHLACFLGGMPEDHIAQVQGCMMVTGRKWWEFVSFDPRLPEPLDLFVQRIWRDEGYIERVEAEVVVFLAEVNAMVAKLQAISTESAARCPETVTLGAVTPSADHTAAADLMP